MMGFVVTSRVSLRSCRRVVRSTASISGLPLLVLSVSELAHIPSNSRISLPTSTFVCSMIRPVRPQWDSMIRTIGLAVIRRRSDFIRAWGVVPSDSSSCARPEDVIPFV